MSIRRAVLCAALLLAGCASTGPIITIAPPRAQVEETPARPGEDMEWHSGHYAFNESKEIYYWVHGIWEPARKGYLWFPGEWEPVGSNGERLGWRWLEGRWERIDMLEELPPAK